MNRRVQDDNHPLVGVGKNPASALERLGLGGGIGETNMIGGVIEVEEIRDAIL